VFAELVRLQDVIEDTHFMKRYVTDFKAAEQITKVVADFLAIAERSDASFILMAMLLRAFDKATLEAPFICLHNAMYERWKTNFDPKGVLKAVVSMAPCFFGDQDMYDFYEVSGADLRRKAITDLAAVFSLEMREDTIADLLSQEGVFTQKYYGPQADGSDSTDTPASGDSKEPSVRTDNEKVNTVMDGHALDYALRSQRASIQWWEAISRMLKADAKAMLKSTSDDADRYRSCVNLASLWDILLAITPTEADVERVFSREGRIMPPGRAKMSAGTLGALILLDLALTVP